MLFSSLSFLCWYLPLVWLVYLLVAKKCRWANLWLFIASLFFYGWGEPKYILIMLFSTVFDYCNGRAIGYFKEKGNQSGAKAILILSIVGNLSILAFFKYTDFVITTLNQLTGSRLSLLGLALPIGISFYTFQTMSYSIDVYRGEVEPQKDIISFGMFVCLFPQLIAGPIVRYSDIQKEIAKRRLTPESVEQGLMRFLIGLSKKVLLANQAGAIFDRISGSGASLTTGLAWLGAICFAFQIYFDFSGYSDMAIGLGRMFGFTFPENFNYPYESASITEFWRRWHMTLSGWFRDYVYIPLGGNRKGIGRQIANLIVVWFLTGLWHGASWNFVLWGMYYGGLLILEKLVLSKVLEKLPGFVGHVYTLAAVLVGWVLFAMEDFGQMQTYLLTMFGQGGKLVDALTIYGWKTWLFFLIILGIGATSLPKKIVGIGRKEKHKPILARAYCLALLVLCLAFLVGDSYNPFLYFRF